jgi:hypothetical protein
MISIDLASGAYIAVSNLLLHGDYDAKELAVSKKPVPSKMANCR